MPKIGEKVVKFLEYAEAIKELQQQVKNLRGESNEIKEEIIAYMQDNDIEEYNIRKMGICVELICKERKSSINFKKEFPAIIKMAKDGQKKDEILEALKDEQEVSEVYDIRCKRK